jgi:sucrose phosphorylase
LDIYQINCTYYSALGNDDNEYLMARAIQFFAPGVPQVYYVGLLAGENDIDLMEKTKQGREINRHAYSIEEIERNIERPVVRKLRNLMKFRNNYPAFSGACVVVDTSDYRLEIHRISHNSVAILRVNFRCMSFEITYGQAGDTVEKLDLEDDS